MGKRKERLDLHARRKLTRVEGAHSTGHDVRVGGGKKDIVAREWAIMLKDHYISWFRNITLQRKRIVERHSAWRCKCCSWTNWQKYRIQYIRCCVRIFEINYRRIYGCNVRKSLACYCSRDLINRIDRNSYYTSTIFKWLLCCQWLKIERLLWR